MCFLTASTRLGVIFPAMGVCGSLSAGATVLTFENFAPEDNTVNINAYTAYIESQSILSELKERAAVFGPEASPQLDGGSTAWFGFPGENVVTLTGPGLFDLQRLDLGVSTIADTSVISVNLVALCLAGIVASRRVTDASRLQTLELNGTNLDSVEISASDDVGMHNINITIVPEPASGGLVMMAMAEFASRRRNTIVNEDGPNKAVFWRARRRKRLACALFSRNGFSDRASDHRSQRPEFSQGKECPVQPH